MPTDFWSHPDLGAALAARDIGGVIRAFRTHPHHGRPILQTTVADWIGLSSTRLSRIENGEPVNDLVKLTRWAHTLRIPHHLLWFQMPSASFDTPATTTRWTEVHEQPHDVRVSDHPEPHMPTRLPLESFTETHLGDALRHLGEQWHLLVKTDNLFGPRFAIKSVREHIDLVNGIAGTVRGAARRDVVGLAARYAESAAWLHEDAGEAASALHWTDRAMEWSYESGDRAMLAWTLFRRSQQATTEGDAARTIGMAEAAGRDSAALSNPMRAAVTQQEALGYALDGDERTTHRKLDQAHAWAAHDDQGDARDGHGSFCTGDYLELQRAHCWSILGRHDKAVVLYEDVLPSLPAAYRRDRGTTLSRFAVAAVAVGEPERAAQLADEALDIARGSGSLRTERAVRDVAAALSPHGHLPAVAAFRAKALSGGAR
ncbi:hypothetical protein [Saccharothrix longispora]|uniref:hypothetical protein n=1 Tax=Saccharothrix longispora TaxID=33920 RepID=UPI0028FD731D|nr:hypothetical protein [Saccharothrix longispora]MBY8850294.1 hypothetical protein [Saccharothrix sp. MB29]MDU0289561.1 hypothetical protein [Saccharothrix longispora]